MPLRPKTKRRLTILAAIAIVGTAASATVVSIRLKHHQMRVQQFRDAGMAAYQARNWQSASDNLSKYLGGAAETDPEALLARGISRGNLPHGDQAHLIAEQKDLTRYLELQPSDDDTRRRLLDVCDRLHEWFDADAVASQILARSPDDVETLKAQLAALKAEGKLDAALAAAQHLDQLRPLDCRTEVVTLDLMNRLGRPSSDLLAVVDKLAVDHPGDPRVDLVRVAADSITGRNDEARKLLTETAAKPSPDDDFTLLLCDYLDTNGLFDQTTALLAAADSHRDVALTSFTARRLFHAGQPAAALARLGPVSGDTPSDWLGLRAMILAGSPKPEDRAQVTELVKTLSIRPDDKATAWIALLPAATDRTLTPRQRITACMSAGLLDADNSDARCLLGRVYQDLGETELAVRHYTEACGIDPAWAGAQLALASSLLDQDRVSDAEPHAQRAVDRDPQDADARALLALVKYRRIPAAAPADQLAAVLNDIRDTRTDRPDDPRLAAAEVDLLARTDNFKAATAAAIADVDAPLVSAAMLAKIAAVASVDKIDIGPEIIAKAGQLHPVDPQSAYDRAIAIATAGDPAVGRRALDADAGPGPAWELVELQYRDATNNAASPDAWAAVADTKIPDPATSLMIQRAVLRSPTANASRPLIDRTIDRLHALTGDEAIDWKLARARWQLGSPTESRDDADAVAASMAELVKTTPSYAQPLVVWAEALEKTGDVNAAIDRLKAAAKIEPDDPDISLRLARLMSRLGQAHDAGDLLDHVASDGHLSPAAVIEAATLLDRSGQRKRAIELLDRTPQTPESDLLHARLAASVDPSDADRIYTRFAASSDPQLVIAAADRLARRGNADAGRTLLARLDSMLAPADAMAAKGTFESEFGQQTAAVTDFTSAITASPGNPRPWRAWAAADLRRRDWAAVADVTGRGLHQVPGDKPLTALAAAAEKFKSSGNDAAFAPLIDAVAADPVDPATAATIDAFTSIPDLTAVVSRYPDYWPARSALVRRLMAAGRYHDAADSATVAANRAPSDPTPAELLTSVWATAGRWENARAAAVNWKSRTPANVGPADLAIAVADLHLGRGEESVDLLSPYLAEAQDSVDKSPDVAGESAVVIDTIARALVATGRTDKAASLLEGPAKKSAAWRSRWLRIIADDAENPASAGPQIDRVEALVPAGSVEQRLAVADTWYRLADRFNDTTSANHAMDVLDPMTDAAHPTVDVFVLLGAVKQQLGDLPAAESADRAALALAPNLPAVQNNLAQVMLLRDEDPAAAAALAQAAITAEPTSAAAHETLGESLLRQGKLEEARAQFAAAIDLDAENVPALAGLAEVDQKSNHPDQAASSLRAARAALEEGRRRYPDATKARLDRIAEALTKSRQATVDVGRQ
jgi:tetratricopeptide (TPR) repeat protein